MAVLPRRFDPLTVDKTSIHSVRVERKIVADQFKFRRWLIVTPNAIVLLLNTREQMTIPVDSLHLAS